MSGFQQALPAEKAHGERRTYVAGCRCALCRSANAVYRREGSLVQRQEIENLKLKVEVAELKLAALQATTSEQVVA